MDSVILPSDVNGLKAPYMVTITLSLSFPVFLLLSLSFLLIHCPYTVRIANKEVKGKWHRFVAPDFFPRLFSWSPFMKVSKPNFPSTNIPNNNFNPVDFFYRKILYTIYHENSFLCVID